MPNLDGGVLADAVAVPPQDGASHCVVDGGALADAVAIPLQDGASHCVAVPLQSGVTSHCVGVAVPLESGGCVGVAGSLCGSTS